MYNFAESSSTVTRKPPKTLPKRPDVPSHMAIHHDGTGGSAEQVYATPTPYVLASTNGAAHGGQTMKPAALPSKPHHVRRVLPAPPQHARAMPQPPPVPGPDSDVEYSEPEKGSPCYDEPTGTHTTEHSPQKPPRKLSEESRYRPPPLPAPFAKADHAIPERGESPLYDQPTSAPPMEANPPKPLRQLSNENKYNPAYFVSTLNRKEKVAELFQYGKSLDNKLMPNKGLGNSVFYDSVDDEMHGQQKSNHSANRPVAYKDGNHEMLYDEVDTVDGNADAEEYYAEANDPDLSSNFQIRRLQNQIGSMQDSTRDKFQSLPRPPRPSPFHKRIRAFTQTTNLHDEETENQSANLAAPSQNVEKLPQRPPLPLPKKPPTPGAPIVTQNSDISSLFEAHTDSHATESSSDIGRLEPKARFHKKFSLIRPKVGNTKSNLSRDASTSMPALNGDAHQKDPSKSHEHTDGFRGKFHAFMRPRKVGKTNSSPGVDKTKHNNRQSAPVIDNSVLPVLPNDRGTTINPQLPLFQQTNKSQNTSSPVMDRDLKKKLAFQKQRSEQQGVLLEEGHGKVTPRSTVELNTDMALFESVLVVTLKEEHNKLVPFISFQFPPKAAGTTDKNDRLQAIPDFCFPDLDCEGSSPRLSIGYGRSETFSFVLTDMDGKRHFGYCRHVLDDSFGPSVKAMPKVFCIISSLGLFSLYSQVLDEVERQQLNSPATVFSLLKTVLSQPLPRPGETLKLPFYSSGAAGMETITLKRPGDSAIHAHVDLRILFDTLSVSMILSVITSLLMEKRVVLCSSSLSVLSACCHGFISLLYPFVWQHTYIPVLPRKLVDICCSPTPFLLGLLSVCLPELEDLPTNEVIIVSLDERKFTEQGDSQNFFPKSIRDEMDKTLNTVNSESKKRDSFVFREHRAKNMLITEVFVQAYLQMIGCFQDHISTDSNGERVFQEDSFCKSSSSKEIKKFRKNFMKTQAFLLFLEPWLAGQSLGSETGLFEQRLSEWKESRKMDFHNFASRVRELLPKSKSGPQEGGGFHRFLNKLTAK